MTNRPISRVKSDELNPRLKAAFWNSNASIHEADKERQKLKESVDDTIDEGWGSLGWDEYE